MDADGTCKPQIRLSFAWAALFYQGLQCALTFKPREMFLSFLTNIVRTSVHSNNKDPSQHSRGFEKFAINSMFHPHSMSGSIIPSSRFRVVKKKFPGAGTRDRHCRCMPSLDGSGPCVSLSKLLVVSAPTGTYRLTQISSSLGRISLRFCLQHVRVKLSDHEGVL